MGGAKEEVANESLFLYPNPQHREVGGRECQRPSCHHKPTVEILFGNTAESNAAAGIIFNGCLSKDVEFC